MLPHDFPPWETVYDHFRRWNESNIWTTALDKLNQVHRKKRPKPHAKLRHH
jgi:putative transposase